MIDKTLVESILDDAQSTGVDYADLRADDISFTRLIVEDALLEHVETRKTGGVGIRVLYKGAIGFAATSDWQAKADLDRVLERALRYAKAAAAHSKTRIILADVKICQDNYQVKEKIPLQTLSQDLQSQLMIDCCKWLQIDDEIKKTVANAHTDCRHELFASTEGAFIESQNNRCSLTISCVAAGSGQRQQYYKRTGGSGGWELASEHPWQAHCEQMAQDAINLTKARSIGEERTTVISDPEFNYLLSHEICGHPSEADRWLGWESAWAGRAWWSDMMGKRVGSELMNVSCDMTIVGNTSYAKYDSEGTPCQKTPLVRDGILVGALHSRQTAAEFGVEPTGQAIAMRSGFLPLVRMGNTFFEPGDWDPEEIIADTKEGIYVVGCTRPSIDQRRYSWKIGTQKGYRIKNGELTEMIRNITVGGIAPEYFKAIDAVGKDCKLSGAIANCMKGQPGQLYYTGNGGGTIRSQAVVIGART
ncbi:MAG: TldD/PmbA family protein [Candidatus Hermodarchaeota archaeon]